MADIKDNATILREFSAAGLPAFPSNVALMDGATFNAPGMMLRDWIAGQIAAAIYSDREQWLAFIHDRSGVTPEAHVAEQSYLMADAMLAARKPPERS